MLVRLLCVFGLCLALLGIARADEFGDAIAAFNKGNYAEAVQLLKPLAEKGDSRAQFKLGTMYHLGLGVTENDQTAMEWFRKSAAQANADAQYQLGYMYTYGFGVPKSEPDPDLQAVQWYFKAALQGHAEAQYNLGLMFLAGKGVVQSHEEGIKWIRRAADLGFPAAKAFLGDYGSANK